MSSDVPNEKLKALYRRGQEVRGMTDIVERLRETTQAMAETASADMRLWDAHSNACLAAAAEIVRLREALLEIERLDYTRAAVNGAAYRAVCIARAALASIKT